MSQKLITLILALLAMSSGCRRDPDWLPDGVISYTQVKIVSDQNPIVVMLDEQRNFFVGLIDNWNSTSMSSKEELESQIAKIDEVVPKARIAWSSFTGDLDEEDRIYRLKHKLHTSYVIVRADRILRELVTEGVGGFKVILVEQNSANK